MTDYPPYNVNSKCIKCGNEGKLIKPQDEADLPPKLAFPCFRCNDGGSDFCRNCSSLKAWAIQKHTSASYQLSEREPAADSEWLAPHMGGYPLKTPPHSELIKRTCMRCGYVWYERPLDSKEEKE